MKYKITRTEEQKNGEDLIEIIEINPARLAPYLGNLLLKLKRADIKLRENSLQYDDIFFPSTGGEIKLKRVYQWVLIC